MFQVIAFTRSPIRFAVKALTLTCSSVRLRFQQPRFAFVQRQPDAEGGAAAHVAFQFNPPVVRADDALHNHQAQAACLFSWSCKTARKCG